jgi:DNA topoisomerase-1
VRDAEVRLSFKGKSGVRHELTLADRRVASVVRRCKAMPGQELFQYADRDGGLHRVSSAEVNDSLSQVAGTQVSAKDFRTWHGSVPALEFTHAICAGEPVRGAATQVITQVAARLGNTVAVCRQAYVHPKVLALRALLSDDAVRASLLAQRGPRLGAPACADGSGNCQTPSDRPVSNVCHRKGSHAEDLGFHDAQRASRPPRREPAARRAGDG